MIYDVMLKLLGSRRISIHLGAHQPYSAPAPHSASPPPRCLAPGVHSASGSAPSGVVGWLRPGKFDLGVTALAVLVVAVASAVFGEEATAAACSSGGGLAFLFFHRPRDQRRGAAPRVRAFVDDVREGRREPEDVLRAAIPQPSVTRAPSCSSASASDAYADRLEQAPSWIPPDDERSLTKVDASRAGDRAPPAQGLGPRRAQTCSAVFSRRRACIQIARLRLEVRIQLAEVEESELGSCGQATKDRRRLERDRHDGAQQRLVALGHPRCDGCSARFHARRQIRPGSDLDGRRDRAGDRRPARDDRRPACGRHGSDEGLVPALADLARASPGASTSTPPPSAFLTRSKRPPTPRPERSRTPSSTRLRRPVLIEATIVDERCNW